MIRERGAADSFAVQVLWNVIQVPQVLPSYAKHIYIHIYIYIYMVPPPCAYIFLFWLLNSSVFLVQQTILEALAQIFPHVSTSFLMFLCLR